MKLTKTQLRYAYHVPDPFKELRPMHDKYGCLHFISMDQYLKEASEPKNIWHQTTFEMVMPGICMVLGFLMICFIIGLSIT